MFNGDRRWPTTTADGSFPVDVTPFPDTVDFSYDQIPAVFPPPQPTFDHHHRQQQQQHTQTQQQPPQKLRPIRYPIRFQPKLIDPISNGMVVHNISGSEVIELSRSSQLGFMPHITPPPAAWVDIVDDQRLGNSEAGGDYPHLLQSHMQESDDMISNFKRKIEEFEFSSSSSSDDTGDLSQSRMKPQNQNRRKRRKKMENFMEYLMTLVMQKQQQMHNQLMEFIEKKEAEAIIREEAWKQQQLEQAKQESAMRAEVASRNEALISLIQSMLKHNSQTPQPLQSVSREEDEGETQVQSDAKFDSGKKRWPKSEVQALITLRTAFDHGFRATGSKTPLWEEISDGLANVGYSRSAKKCREKWENITKYFKRLKEMGRKRPESSKLWPYYPELEILYQNGLLDNGGRALNSPNDEDVYQNEAFETLIADSSSPGVLDVSGMKS
ncbi:hypothetical protein Dimus_017748 [Dionaea muscipula]